MQFRGRNELPLANLVGNTTDKIGGKRKVYYRTETVSALELLKGNPCGLSEFDPLAGLVQKRELLQHGGRNQPIGLSHSLVDDGYRVQNVFIAAGQIKEQNRVTGQSKRFRSHTEVRPRGDATGGDPRQKACSLKDGAFPRHECPLTSFPWRPLRLS